MARLVHLLVRLLIRLMLEANAREHPKGSDAQPLLCPPPGSELTCPRLLASRLLLMRSILRSRGRLGLEHVYAAEPRRRTERIGGQPTRRVPLEHPAERRDCLGARAVEAGTRELEGRVAHHLPQRVVIVRNEGDIASKELVAHAAKGPEIRRL